MIKSPTADRVDMNFDIEIIFPKNHGGKTPTDIPALCGGHN